MKFLYVYVIIGDDKTYYGKKRVLSICLSKEDAERAVAFYSKDYDDVEYNIFTPESFSSYDLIHEGTFNIKFLNSNDNKIFGIFEIKKLSYTTSTTCVKKDTETSNSISFKFCQYTDINGETESELIGEFKSFKDPDKDYKEWKNWLIDEINKKATGFKIGNTDDFDF